MTTNVRMSRCGKYCLEDIAQNILNIQNISIFIKTVPFKSKIDNNNYISEIAFRQLLTQYGKDISIIKHIKNKTTPLIQHNIDMKTQLLIEEEKTKQYELQLKILELELKKNTISNTINNSITNTDIKHNTNKKQTVCIDCGAHIYKTSTRCKDCSVKHRLHNNNKTPSE